MFDGTDMTFESTFYEEILATNIFILYNLSFIWIIFILKGKFYPSL